MRLDKFISNLWYGSRKEVIKVIKNWFILVNQEIINNPDFKLNFWDKVQIWEDLIEYKKFIYLILNKPIWYVCSKKNDWWHPSYLELLQDCPYWEIINIVWRLDFDTSGLLFLTNDWELTHNIITPKKEIYKKYLVVWATNISDKNIEKLEKWVKIDLDNTWNYNFISKEAKAKRISDNSIYLEITEWKFHQIKKMFEAIWNKVIKLKRISVWSLVLWNLEEWKWRYLKDDEIKKIKEI